MLKHTVILVLICTAQVLSCPAPTSGPALEGETTTIVPVVENETSTTPSPVVSSTSSPTTTSTTTTNTTTTTSTTPSVPSIVLENISNTANELPQDFYFMAMGYIRRITQYSNITLNDIIKLANELETWEPPRDVIVNYPYYLAGYDYDNRPIWVGEGGKYNLRDIIERGQERMDLMEKYAFQGCYRVLKNLYHKSLEENTEVDEIYVIVDMAGFDIRQVTSTAAIDFALRMFQKYIKAVVPVFGGAIIINTNYAAEVALNLARPFIGPLMEKIEVFGPNLAKWKARLQKILPPEVIPTWYGGRNGFKPLAVYG